MPRDDELMDDLSLSEEDVEETDDVEEVEDPDGESADEGDVEEPEDLAAAFAAVQRAGKGEPDGDLDDAGDGGDPGDDDAPVDDDETYEALEDDRQDPDGGPGDAYSGADYQAVQEKLRRDVAQVALQQAATEFHNEGIRAITMNDLYSQDRQTGRVTYKNPDDPSRPFASRMEAQQWIDSFNSQLRQEVQKRAREINRDLTRQVAPAQRLLQFAPTYGQMPADVQEVFDDLIEDYAILNASGQVVGYNCDLDKMASKAQRIAAKYVSKDGGRAKEKAKAEPQRRPATDIRSHGTRTSGGRSTTEEPRTLEEAFRIIREQRKAGN